MLLSKSFISEVRLGSEYASVVYEVKFRGYFYDFDF